MTRRILLILTLAALAAAVAEAQPRAPQPRASQPGTAQLQTPRGIASFNAGWQSPDRQFDDSFTFQQYLENATVDVDHKVKSGPVYEGGLGVRLWRALGVGVAFSKYTDTSTAKVTGSIPHPFFFGRGRSMEGDAAGIERDETSVHAQVLAFVPAGRRMLVVLSAGPSFVTLRQGLVTRVHYDESYPFDTATFRTADTTSENERRTGFNAGADIVFRFGNTFGIGALIRYTQATIDLSPAEGRTISVDAGGLQAGVGMRVIF